MEIEKFVSCKRKAKKVKLSRNYLISLRTFSFLLLINILLLTSASKIKLIIEMTGPQQLLFNGFGVDPSKVTVNGNVKDCTKSCQLTEGSSEIILEFNDPIDSFKDMFLNLNNIKEIDLKDLVFSGVTVMENMFQGCSKLEKINFGNINPSSVKSMTHTFAGCTSLTSLDFSKWDFASIVDMSNMLLGCSGLKEIKFGNVNTHNLLFTPHLFEGCSSLTSVDLSNFDLSRVTNMYGLFLNCYNLNI